MNNTNKLLQALTPFALVLLLIIIYLFTYNYLVLCSYSEAVDCKAFVNLKSHLSSLLQASGSDNMAIQIQAYSGRLTWSMIVGISIFANIFALLAGLYVAFKSVYIKSKWHKAGIVSLILLTITLIPFLFRSSHEGNEAHPWRQFLHKSLSKDLALIDRLNPNLDILALSIALLIAIATSLFLFHALKNKVDTNHSFYINILLYTGAFLLIVHTLRINAFLNWSLSYINPNEAVYESLLNIASVIVFSQGAFYTLMLAAVFLPAFLILRSNEISPATDIESKIKSLVSIGIPKTLAILGPLLTGPISQLL